MADITRTITTDEVKLETTGQTIIFKKTSDGSLDVHTIVEDPYETWETILDRVEINNTITDV